MTRSILRFTGEVLFSGIVVALLFWSGTHVLYALIELQRLQ